MIKYLKRNDAKCVGCLNCVSACSKAYFKDDNPAKSAIQAIPAAHNEFRLIACDQECRKCVGECPTMAITVNGQGVVMINRNLCVGCLACVAVCPIEAMRFYPGAQSPFKCVACGICVKSCPKQALEISEKEDSPASRWPFEAAAAVRHLDADKETK